MDRDAISAVTHGDLPYANPLDPADVDAAIAAVPLAKGARVLDVGSGTGTLLARIKAANPGVVAVGIEPARGWARTSRERGVDEVHEVPYAEAELDPGSFDLVCCIASSHAIGAWDEALRALHALTRPGGAALVGEGFWARTPSAGYLEALGGAAEDELPGHDALLDGARAAGWAVEAERVASIADWTRYEETLIATGERALDAADDPDVRSWVDAARGRWEHPDGRDTLGFTLLTLRRAR